MKHQILIIILISILSAKDNNQSSYNCKIEYVLVAHKNLNELTNEIVKDFLLTFDSTCSNNIEYSEFSNQTLFEVLDSNPQLFCHVMRAESKIVHYQVIIDALKAPINDGIPLNEILHKIENLKPNDKLKMDLVKSLNIAITK